MECSWLSKRVSRHTAHGERLGVVQIRQIGVQHMGAAWVHNTPCKAGCSAFKDTDHLRLDVVQVQTQTV